MRTERSPLSPRLIVVGSDIGVGVPPEEWEEYDRRKQALRDRYGDDPDLAERKVHELIEAMGL